MAATAASSGVGWRRGGENIAYYPSHIRGAGHKSGTHTLSFTYSSPHPNDTVYFAYSVPHTFTDLQSLLSSVLARPDASKRIRHRVLCQTIAGNPCPLLTVTSFDGSPASMGARPAVIVSARVHPGETVSSWAVKGLLEFLLGDSPDAQVLRDNFIFKIVPMLNPDGVIVGNHRCNLSGTDLNRVYGSPSRVTHPTIHAFKTMVQNLVRERQVVLLCDLHGHSRAHGAFVYGCETSAVPSMRLKERVFPFMLSRISTLFALNKCKYQMQPAKAGTGRIVGRRDFGLLNSFTLELSFAGAIEAGTQSTTLDYEKLGRDILDALLDYCDPDQTKAQLALQKLSSQFERGLKPVLALQQPRRRTCRHWPLPTNARATATARIVLSVMKRAMLLAAKWAFVADQAYVTLLPPPSPRH